MRPLNKVVDAIITQIPDTGFEARDYMIRDLRSVSDSWRYSAPENHPLCWNRVAEILGYYIGPPYEDWHEEIKNIFADKKDFRKFLKEGE